MKSIQILQAYKVAKISKIYTVRNFLVIEGDDYENVKYVILNGIATADIALQGGKLYIQMPQGLTFSEIKTIYPIIETRKVDKDCLLQLSLGINPKPIEGISRLIQLFVKVLFTSRGTNLYNKEIGGDLARTLSRGVDLGNYEKLLPEIVNAVNKTAKDIKARQASLKLPDEEILVEAKVGSIVPDPGSGTINVRIILKSKAKEGSFSLSF